MILGRSSCLFAHTPPLCGVQKQRIFQKKNVDFFGKPCIILICMDTMNIRGSAGHDELAELRNHKKIVGMKQLKKHCFEAESPGSTWPWMLTPPLRCPWLSLLRRRTSKSSGSGRCTTWGAPAASMWVQRRRQRCRNVDFLGNKPVEIDTRPMRARMKERRNINAYF